MHIAYISMGAMGHVLAALPFCGELKKMGHRVSFFTAEFLREQVEAFGVDFYPVESPLNKGGKRPLPQSCIFPGYRGKDPVHG